MWRRTLNCRSLLIYRPPEDERLSWPGWLTYSGRLTNISGSATGRAQDGERTLARDLRSTAAPRCDAGAQWRRTILFTFIFFQLEANNIINFLIWWRGWKAVLATRGRGFTKHQKTNINIILLTSHYTSVFI